MPGGGAWLGRGRVAPAISAPARAPARSPRTARQPLFLFSPPVYLVNKTMERSRVMYVLLLVRAPGSGNARVGC